MFILLWFVSYYLMLMIFGHIEMLLNFHSVVSVGENFWLRCAFSRNNLAHLKKEQVYMTTRTKFLSISWFFLE